MNSNPFSVNIAGEDSLIVYFNDSGLISANAKISHLKQALKQTLADNLIELIPSYNSLLVIFDVYKTDSFYIKKVIKEQCSNAHYIQQDKTNTIELPVYYSIESGPDLKAIADSANLSIEDVIDIHQSQTYQVFALGFAPGFAFLGEVDQRIAAPRLNTPRDKVPKGAVGIADRQTAVYPASSPGGWNLIGLCPIELFDPANEPHVPFSVGDTVKFKAISEQEFIALGGSFE